MKRPRDGERGQTLVIVALAAIPIIMLLGLVIDGGWAYTQQRRTQNAMDAAANAGAVMLVQDLPFRAQGQTQPKTDGQVAAEIVSSAQQNGIVDTPPTAVYTDILGTPLNPTVVVGS